MEDKCCVCGNPEDFEKDSESELRPYGPGGKPICFRCAFANDETTKQTEQNFTTIMDASIAATGVFVIGDEKSKHL